MRNQGTFQQTIELPPSTAGQFLALVGRGAADRVNPDGSITGLPYLYGLFGDESRTRFVGYLQGQRLRGEPERPGTWVTMSGVFQVPTGAARLILSLRQGQRRGDPQNGSIARFDDIGVYLFATEAQAHALIGDWPNPAASYPELPVRSLPPSPSPSAPEDPFRVWRSFRQAEPLAPPADPSTAKPFNADWSAILPVTEAPKTARPCSRHAPGPIGDVWLPEPREVALFEAALAPLLQGALDRDPRPTTPPRSSDRYHRQYVGLIVGGRRIIYVNGLVLRPPLVTDLSPDWRKTLVNVCDGGASYFGAEFDIETGRVQNLAFNSPR